MIELLAGASSGAAAVLLILHLTSLRAWAKRERAWTTERARLVDSALSHSAGDFRVRQTTPTVQFDGHTMERVAKPNVRSGRPTPIGLGGEWGE